MKVKVKDGWHKVEDVEVYVENGVVLRGTDADHTTSLHPYRWDSKAREYALVKPKFATFKAGYGDKGLYSMK